MHPRARTGSIVAVIAITGAAGFIGSHTAEAVLRRGDTVVGIDNFDPFYSRARKERNVSEVRGLAEGRFEFAELDICDCDALARVLGAHGVESIIHLAAKAGVRPSIEDPLGYVRANVDGTMSVLEASRRAGLKRVVLASSSSVYGNNKKVPFAESDPVEEPISPYAATKRACELIAHTHHHLTGMPTACLRFFTVIGPRQRPDLAVSMFLERVSRGEQIRMFGDGSTSRDYTYVDDIVRGVLAACDRIDQHGFRVWNLGGSEPISLSDMIATIGRVVGKDPVIKQEPMQPGDVERTCADPQRARSELGFEATTPFTEGVQRQWEHQRALPE